MSNKIYLVSRQAHYIYYIYFTLLCFYLISFYFLFGSFSFVKSKIYYSFSEIYYSFSRIYYSFSWIYKTENRIAGSSIYSINGGLSSSYSAVPCCSAFTSSLSSSASTERIMNPFILSPVAFIRSFVPFGSVTDTRS